MRSTDPSSGSTLEITEDYQADIIQFLNNIGMPKLKALGYLSSTASSVEEITWQELNALFTQIKDTR